MIGSPELRVDGPEKVSGAAQYALEYKVNKPLYAIPIKSSVNSGTINSINTAEIESMPGVVKVFHNGNMPELKSFKDAPPYIFVADKRLPFEDNKISHIGQYVALVLAETLEDAMWAARNVKVDYNKGNGAGEIYNLDAGETITPEEQGLQFSMGDVSTAINAAETTITETYTIPTEHHNPMEISNCTAIWDGDKVTIYDATQGVTNYQNAVAWAFGQDKKNVRIISKYIGGGFGCKGNFWSHTLLAAAAAKATNRPVKINQSREDMFTCCGHRPRTVQTMTIAGDNQGKISAVEHKTLSYTNQNQDYFERCGDLSKVIYDFPNVNLVHEYKLLNLPSPTYMRAPGHSTGAFALESALDEYATKINLDPIELRMKNYTEVCAFDKKPFSLIRLKECYERGAKSFGWDKRKSEPMSTTRDGKLIGYGMATATYPANKAGGAVTMSLSDEGILTVETAVQDIGTGTWTILGQIAADTVGIPYENVRMKIGDSDYPQGFLSGGSNLTATAGDYIMIAGEKLKNEILNLSVAQEKSPHYKMTSSRLKVKDGVVSDGNGKEDSLTDILKRSGKKEHKITDDSQVGKGGFGYDPKAEFSYHSFGAIFAEVEVDPDLGIVSVPRLHGVFDVGKIMNEKTGKSQLYGGLVWGYGMAMLEKTDFSPDGRIVNPDLAEYYVPVNADIGEMQVEYIDEPDYNFSKSGGRGIGEIGIVGTAAAIANAVYNATGKRVRDLPITMDKLI